MKLAIHKAQIHAHCGQFKVKYKSNVDCKIRHLKYFVLLKKLIFDNS